MTKAMPFLQKVILLSYDPRPFVRVIFFLISSGSFPVGKFPADDLGEDLLSLGRTKDVQHGSPEAFLEFFAADQRVQKGTLTV